ncbi:ATP synthase subunit alpha, mitochondrial [Fonsecaea nubica]|uniref:ATP synthase subunit alpha, mitochondrial n=1 Tax=Fonsecaea nubica TaxID=856822 RepID=A0A178D832_9EURO|nr:ATP synthase subunit alpha, mitochondrial [Fonsecaea nubica]OAL37371.1 ATP synthase subunit alpha, mitochondrial [Fonsecaea nubica]
MKAARLYGAKDVRVEEVRDLPLSGPDAVVEVEWCGICGSDLHFYLGGGVSGVELQDKCIMGHEICGRVVYAPPGSPVKQGQAVMVDPRIYCTSCSNCTKSRTNGCNVLRGLGVIGSSGGLSERVSVRPSMLYALPDSVDLSTAALIEPLAVAMHGVKLSGILQSDKDAATALILGGGPVGIGVVQVLRAFGVTRIMVSEPSTARREYVQRFGATAFNPLAVDVVFDCAGAAAALKDGLGSLCFGGRYVNLALWETEIPLSLTEFTRREIHLVGSCAYDDSDFKEAVDAFIQGRFTDLSSMVTARIPLNDIVTKGLNALLEEGEKHVKIMNGNVLLDKDEE